MSLLRDCTFRALRLAAEIFFHDAASLKKISIYANRIVKFYFYFSCEIAETPFLEKNFIQKNTSLAFSFIIFEAVNGIRVV